MLMALTALCLLVAGCASPTLPLPPPELPEVSAIDSDGYVTLQGAPGSVDAYAIVYGFNTRTSEGVIEKATSVGSYKLRIRAILGDGVEIWQESGADRSAQTYVVVKPK